VVLELLVELKQPRPSKGANFIVPNLKKAPNSRIILVVFPWATNIPVWLVVTVLKCYRHAKFITNNYM